MFLSKRGKLIGKKLIVYADGAVILKSDRSELGYLDSKDADEAFAENFKGAEIDFFVKDKINVPFNIKRRVEPILREIQQPIIIKEVVKHMPKTSKTLKIDLLTEMLGEFEVGKLLERYQDFLSKKKRGILGGEIAEMYQDYANNVSIHDIAVKYGYKKEKIVENKIAYYALALMKQGISPKKAKQQITKYQVEDVKAEDIIRNENNLKPLTFNVLKLFYVDKISVKEIAHQLNVSEKYIYLLRQKGTEKLRELKNV